MSFFRVGSGTANAVKYISSVANKRIKSNIHELESAMTSLDQAIDGYNSVALRLGRMCDRMQNDWKGENAVAYVGRLRSERQVIVEMSKLLFRVRELAMRRKNKLRERQIWAQEINNAADTVSDALKAVKIVGKIF